MMSTEKETVEKAYQALMEEHRALLASHEEVVAEKEEAVGRMRRLEREADSRKNEKVDVMLRAENDRMRADL